jgi:thiol-disulfide isomerase/thioredoxin
MSSKQKSFYVKNGLWVLLVVLLIIPQSRRALQVSFNKVVSYLNQVQIRDQGPSINLSDLVLEDTYGNVISQDKVKDKVRFVNFWATWCPPCIAEMTSINDLYLEYNTEVEFLLISNETFEKQLQFKEENRYDFEMYRPVSLPVELSGRSIPRTYIIDREGKVLVAKTGAVNWSSQKIRKLLNRLIE